MRNAAIIAAHRSSIIYSDLQAQALMDFHPLDWTGPDKQEYR